MGDPIFKRAFFMCDAFRGGVLSRPNLSDVSSIPHGKLHTPLLTIFKRAYLNLANSSSTDGSAGEYSLRCLFLYQTALATITSYEYDSMLRVAPDEADPALRDAPRTPPDGTDDKVHDRNALVGNEIDGDAVQAVFKFMQISAMMGYEPLVRDLTALLSSKFDWVGPIAAIAQQAVPKAKENAELIVQRALSEQRS